MRNWILPAITSCTLASGCFVETDSPRRHPVEAAEGTVTVDWTVDGVKDPSECRQATVSEIDVVVQTPEGDVVGEYRQDCETFATSISLPPGDYTANAVLLDGAGTERTTSVDVDPFTVVGGTDLDVPIDFPASSFR
jgi:hypothetical protein